jgi:hypothetical protein
MVQKRYFTSISTTVKLYAEEYILAEDEWRQPYCAVHTGRKYLDGYNERRRWTSDSTKTIFRAGTWCAFVQTPTFRQNLLSLSAEQTRHLV